MGLRPNIVAALTAGSGAPAYTAKAVNFDGSTFLNTSSLISTDNEFFSMSGWFNVADWSTAPNIAVSDPVTNDNNLIYGSAAEQVSCIVSNNAGNNLSVVTPPILTPGWHNLIFSMQTNFEASPIVWWVASNSDGVKLFAAAQNGFIYTSTNSGASWTKQTGSSALAWNAVCCSQDGSKVFAVAQDGNVYVSTDGGVNWGATAVSGATGLFVICCSANGATVLAGDGVGGGHLYLSTNTGSSFSSEAGALGWSCVAMSSSAGLMVAFGGDGSLYTSPNGTVWTVNATAPANGWNCAAISSDETKIVLGSNDGSGSIALSTNGGGAWSNIGPDGSTNYNSLAASDDFSVICAPALPGFVNTTTNLGGAWSHATNGNYYRWYSIACSLDGTKIIGGAGSDGGKIHISADSGDGWAGIQVSDSKRAVCYIDGVQAIFTINDSTGTFDVVINGLPYYIGADTFGDNLTGDVADLWIAPGVSLVGLDGNISPTNLAKFIDPTTKKPVNPSGFPSAPMLFSGDHTGFATNQGTGGAFTVTGTLTNASTSPSD